MKALHTLPLFAIGGPYGELGTGFKGLPGGPSQQAAERFSKTFTGLRQRVWDAYLDALPWGMTADEAAQRLNLSLLSVRPRVAELHRLGFLQPSEQRRPNSSGATATVWKAREAALLESTAA